MLAARRGVAWRGHERVARRRIAKQQLVASAAEKRRMNWLKSGQSVANEQCDGDVTCGIRHAI